MEHGKVDIDLAAISNGSIVGLHAEAPEETVEAILYTINIDHCYGRVYASKIEEKEVWICDPYKIGVNYAEESSGNYFFGRNIHVFRKEKPRSKKNAQSIRFPKSLADKYLQYVTLGEEIKKTIPKVLEPPAETVHKKRSEWSDDDNIDNSEDSDSDSDNK